MTGGLQPGPTRGRLATAAALCGVLLAASAASAGSSADAQLQEIERALQQKQSESEVLGQKAMGLRKDIEALQRDSVQAAHKTQNLESRLTAIEEQLAELQSQHNTKSTKLAARRSQLIDTLAALQRLAAQPSKALLVVPGQPIERVRSAMLLKAAIPAIEDRADRLRRDLLELKALRSEIEGRRSELAETAQALADERRRLDGLLGRKKGLHQATLDERTEIGRRADALAAEAEDLRDLVDRLSKEARERVAREAEALAEQAAPGAAPSEAPQAAEEAGATQQALAAPAAPSLQKPENVRALPSGGAIAVLVMPVRGRLLQAYGQSVPDADAGAKGITIATRSQAQVVAPYDGQVVYAGDFRGYGQILIIEHGGRYHTLLAGLERIDAVVGQWILAGEPIGVMGGRQGGDPALYLELRRAGQPVNPLPWIATIDEKIEG